MVVKAIIGVIVGGVVVVGTILLSRSPEKVCRNKCYDNYEANLVKLKNYCAANKDQPFGDFNCSVGADTVENVLTECYSECQRLP